MNEPNQKAATGFPNKADDHADTDDILRAELKAAGIPTMQEASGEPPEYMAKLLRDSSGEVKTSVMGSLHGWTFKRAWYYWMCSGPGIEIAAAERLQESHGETVRASGDCACRGPRFWFKGLACGSYHVDDAEGLKALADTIRGLAAAPAPAALEGASQAQSDEALMRQALEALDKADSVYRTNDIHPITIANNEAACAALRSRLTRAAQPQGGAT